MLEFEQVEAEKALLETFFKFAGIHDVTVSARRLVTKAPDSDIHDKWNVWAAQRRAKGQEIPVSSFFEMERFYNRREENHLYLVPSRPLLRDEWHRVLPLLKALETASIFKSGVRIPMHPYPNCAFTLKKLEP